MLCIEVSRVEVEQFVDLKSSLNILKRFHFKNVRVVENT